MRPILAAVMLAGLPGLAVPAWCAACDPSGPPPPELAPGRAAAMLLHDNDPGHGAVLFGRIAGYDAPSDSYRVQVLRWYRGSARTVALRAKIETTSCDGLRPEPGQSYVLTGSDDRAWLQIAGSNYYSNLPGTDTLQPALERALARRPASPPPRDPDRPWWKFWAP